MPHRRSDWRLGPHRSYAFGIEMDSKGHQPFPETQVFDFPQCPLVSVEPGEFVELYHIFDASGDGDIVYQNSPYGYGTDKNGWKGGAVDYMVSGLTESDPYYILTSKNPDELDITVIVSIFGRWIMLAYGPGVDPMPLRKLWRQLKKGPYQTLRDNMEIFRTLSQ